MYTMEYLLYHLRPFGVIPYRNELPNKIPWESIEKQHQTDLQHASEQRKIMMEKITNTNNNKTKQIHA